MPRWTWVAALAVAVAAGLVLRSRATPEALPIGDAPEIPRDTLVIAVADDPKSFLSPLATSMLEQGIGELIGISLLEADFDCGLTYSPRLARTWRWRDEGLTIEFELRDDLVWEDGDPIDAADVALTFALLADPNVRSPRAAAVTGLDPALAPWVVDATHVAFTFTEARDPNAMLAAIATIPLVPAHKLKGVPKESAVIAEHPLNTVSPLSAGPWRLSHRNEDEKITFEANPRWNGPPPRLRRIVLRVIPAYADRLAALIDGGVDMLDGIHVADAERVPAHSRLARRGYRTQDAIFWNNVARPETLAVAPTKRNRPAPRAKAHPLFGDIRVRTALSMAIDTDRLVKDLLSSPTTGDVYGKRSVGTVSPANCAAHAGNLAPLPLDVAGATAMLASAGWSDKNGDGIVENGGSPFRFTLLTYAGSPRRELAAAAIQTDLRAVGVDMQIELLEPAALNDRLRTREFDAVLGGWTATPYPSASNWVAGDELNFVSYQNPAVPRWLETADSASDPASSAAGWHDLQVGIYRDQPWTFLYWVDDLVATDGRFEGTRHDALFPWRHTERWSVPPEKVKYPL